MKEIEDILKWYISRAQGDSTMSTPEIELLIKILPRVKREHSDWMTKEEAKTLDRMIRELFGIPNGEGNYVNSDKANG